MGKKQKFAADQVMADEYEPAQEPAAAAPEPAAPVAEAAAPVVAKPEPVLVLGAKAPKHRVGHNSAAWAVITPMLPAKAGDLAKAVGVLPNIGGPKGNGMLYISYAVRRGWLAEQAQ